MRDDLPSPRRLGGCRLFALFTLVVAGSFVADSGAEPGTLAAEIPVARPSTFAVRGWESQVEDFWCRWMGGSPRWFQNERYLLYLRDALSRAPDYRINTFMLIGRGEQGELHTFVPYAAWKRLIVEASATENQVQSGSARRLALPVAVPLSGPDLAGNEPCRLRIRRTPSAVEVQITAVAEPP